MSSDELAKLLEAARTAHEGRREYDAVAQAARDRGRRAPRAPREAELLAELARVLDEELLDDAAAQRRVRAPARAAPGRRGRGRSHRAERREAGKWRDLVERYVQEAQGAGDPAFHSSLLVSAAEVAYRYGRERRQDGASASRAHRVARCARRSSSTRRTGAPRCSSSACSATRGAGTSSREALERFADEATQKDEKIAGCVRLARVFAKKLKSPERAAARVRAGARPGARAPRGDELPRRLLHAQRDVGPPRRALRGAAPTGALRGKEDESARSCRSRWCTGGCAASPRRRSRSSSGCASSSPRTRDARLLPRVVRGARRDARASRRS